MVRVLALITLITSIFGLLFGGFMLFLHFDIPGQSAGCSTGIFRTSEEECALIARFGGHAVWLSKVKLAFGTLITNLLDSIAAILLRKMMRAGLILYLISFLLYVATLLYTGIEMLFVYELIYFVPTVIMLLLYLSCAINSDKLNPEDIKA